MLKAKLRQLWHTGGIWPVGLVAAMTVFIAVNLAFVTSAVRLRPQLVSKNYYAEGENLRIIAEREAAGAATGWQVTLRHVPSREVDLPLVELRVTDAAGRACDSLNGDVTFYRPSEQQLDIPAQPLCAVGGGRYLVFPPRPLERGAWQAVAELRRGNQVLNKRIPLFVEGE